MPRLDSQAKSTGTAEFAIDVMLPGMMTAVVQRPPRFGAKVQSVDAHGREGSAPASWMWCRFRAAWPLSRSDTYAAKKGREALKVTWDESGAENAWHRRDHGGVQATRQLEGSCSPPSKHGDAAAGLKGAAKIVKAEFEMPYLAHAPMEPLTAVCRLSADRCEIWAGAQFQTIDQMNAATAIGLKPEQVVHQHACRGWHVRSPREHGVGLHLGSGLHREGDGRQSIPCDWSGHARTTSPVAVIGR